MEITCNIIRDLLPLYQDRVLSNDSCSLVKEHLGQCKSCQAYQKQLEDRIGVSNAERYLIGEQNALIRIKRAILYKRIISVVIAVVLLTAAGSAGYYLYCERECYVTYEESGVQVDEEGILTVKHLYSQVQSIISPDKTTQFFWVSNTAYERRREKQDSGERYVCKIDLVVPGEPEISALEELREAYYLPEQYQYFWFSEDAETAAAQVEEIKQKSHLIWKKKR